MNTNKNHFFFGYSGNKRKETPIIYDYIKDKLNDIETIIEPFCGSCAFSFYISSLHPNKYKYILNDNNEYLIQLLNISRDGEQLKIFNEEINNLVKDINKEKYDKIKKEGMTGWFISELIHSIRCGLYKLDYKPKEYNFENIPIINFLRTENITIYNIDGVEIIEKYKDDNKNLIFLDPPYLIAENTFYSNTNLNVYEYLYNNNIDTLNAFIILVLETNWIIQLLFKNNIKNQYNKLYQPSKKNTSHLIISNHL